MFNIQPKTVFISSRRPSAIVLILFKIGGLFTASLKMGRKIASRIKGIALIAFPISDSMSRQMTIISLINTSTDKGFAFMSTNNGRVTPNSLDE